VKTFTVARMLVTHAATAVCCCCCRGSACRYDCLCFLVIAVIITLLPVGVQSIVISMSVCACFSVCWYVSKTTRPNFIKILCRYYLWPRTQSSSGGSATRCVLPVLWMTSFFPHNGANGPETRRCICLVQFIRWRHQSSVRRVVWSSSPCDDYGGGASHSAASVHILLIV